jgi:hypothetical protein
MTHCPECHRPAAGAAFYTTANYLRCSLGHVFPAQPEPVAEDRGFYDTLGDSVPDETEDKRVAW